MNRKSNLVTVRREQWNPSPALTAEQKILRVLSRERDRATARIAVIENLLEAKDRAQDQLAHIRDFAEKVMVDAEVKSDEIARLQRILTEKDARVAELETALKSATHGRVTVHRFDKPAAPPPEVEVEVSLD